MGHWVLKYWEYLLGTEVQEVNCSLCLVLEVKEWPNRPWVQNLGVPLRTSGSSKKYYTIGDCTLIVQIPSYLWVLWWTVPTTLAYHNRFTIWGTNSAEIWDYDERILEMHFLKMQFMHDWFKILFRSCFRESGTWEEGRGTDGAGGDGKTSEEQ